jgi:enediyne biosynthesis protein CalE3
MLLNDEVRMEAYRRAILQNVKTGDTVLDVGSGSGILAMFACQAGASRVYAVERGPAIRAARELAGSNGFGDRIVFLNQDIHDVQLGEPVDLVVSELIGKAVLGQEMANITGLCRDRFLRPGGRMIPERVDLAVAPVEAPEVYSKTLLPGMPAWGIDFSRLQKYSSNVPISARVPAGSLLASGQLAYSYLALTSPPVDLVDASVTFRAGRSGVLHGLVAWFSAVLAPGVELTNHPPGLLSWDNLVFPLPEPVPIDAGTTIAVRLRGRCNAKEPLTWVWQTAVRRDGKTIAEYGQSTFFGWLFNPKEIPQ